jgi:hypothetical protein
MIGNTPLVRLNKIPKDEGIKCEIGKIKEINKYFI